MITNSEYVEFVQDAGYARRELWTESGWGWKMFRNVKCPQYWVPEVRYSFYMSIGANRSQSSSCSRKSTYGILVGIVMCSDSCKVFFRYIVSNSIIPVH